MTAPIQVISAGAGSGKTYTLTRELERLLASGSVAPAGVIASPDASSRSTDQP